MSSWVVKLTNSKFPYLTNLNIPEANGHAVIICFVTREERWTNTNAVIIMLHHLTMSNRWVPKTFIPIDVIHIPYIHMHGVPSYVKFDATNYSLQTRTLFFQKF